VVKKPNKGGEKETTIWGDCEGGEQGGGRRHACMPRPLWGGGSRDKKKRPRAKQRGSERRGTCSSPFIDGLGCGRPGWLASRIEGEGGVCFASPVLSAFTEGGLFFEVFT